MANEQSNQSVRCGIGYPQCHCNDCLDDVEQFHGFDKKTIYYYEGIEVKISTFCPLEHCCTFFIIDAYGRNGYCKWLNCEDVITNLIPIHEVQLQLTKRRESKP